MCNILSNILAITCQTAVKRPPHLAPVSLLPEWRGWGSEGRWKGGGQVLGGGGRGVRRKLRRRVG